MPLGHPDQPIFLPSWQTPTAAAPSAPHSQVSSSSAPNSPPASPPQCPKDAAESAPPQPADADQPAVSSAAACAGTPDQPFRLRSPASFRVPRLSQPPSVNTPRTGPNDTPHSTPLSPKAKPFYPRRLRLNSDADAAPTDPDSAARPSSTPLSPKAKPFYPAQMRGLFSPALFSPSSLTRCASLESPAQPRAAGPPDTSTLMSPVIPLAAPFTPGASVELGPTYVPCWGGRRGAVWWSGLDLGPMLHLH